MNLEQTIMQRASLIKGLLAIGRPIILDTSATILIGDDARWLREINYLGEILRCFNDNYWLITNEIRKEIEEGIDGLVNIRRDKRRYAGQIPLNRTGFDYHIREVSRSNVKNEANVLSRLIKRRRTLLSKSRKAEELFSPREEDGVRALTAHLKDKFEATYGDKDWFIRKRGISDSDRHYANDSAIFAKGVILSAKQPAAILTADQDFKRLYYLMERYGKWSHKGFNSLELWYLPSCGQLARMARFSLEMPALR